MLFSENRISRAFALVIFVLTASQHAVGQSLPDLVPELSNISIRTNQSVSFGDVAEGCAHATDGRTLISFTHTAWNDGPGDLFVGDPQCPVCEENPNQVCGNPLFICSGASGHNHPHMQEFSFYTVRNQIGEVVATGHKEGFCLVNMSCRDGNFPDVSAYPSCSILSAGCADIYSSGIGCQYVDITDLPPGNYLLDVTLNKNRVMAETDFSNNTSLVPFEICAQNKAQSGDFTLRYPKKTGQDRKFSLTTRSRIIDAKRKFNPLKDQLTLELFQNTDSLYSPSATIILPPGLPGSGCDPRDGWQKIETGHWRYRSYSGSTSPSCYASGITLSSVELKRLSKRSPRYRITWTGKMNPTVLPGRTSTLRAFVSLNGTTSNSNETCTSPVTLDSCTLKEPKSQPTLHCK